MTACRRLVDIGRRQFLRGGGTALAAAAAAAGVGSSAKAAPAAARVSYPSTGLANIRDLKVDVPFDVYLPEAAEVPDEPVHVIEAPTVQPAAKRLPAMSARRGRHENRRRRRWHSDWHT